MFNTTVDFGKLENFKFNKPYIFCSDPSYLIKGKNKIKKHKIKEYKNQKINFSLKYKKFLVEEKNQKTNYHSFYENNYINYDEKIYSFKLIKNNNKVYEIQIKLNQNQKLKEVVNILIRRNYLLNHESKSYKFYLDEKIINNNFTFKNLKIPENTILIIQNCHWKKIKKNYFLNTRNIIKKSKYLDTIPSYEKLLQMTNKELSEIKNFTLYNQNGIIEFLGYTDIRNLDFDKIIQLNKESVFIYEKCKRPLKEIDLNKPAIITMFNICPNKFGLNSFNRIISKKVKKMNGKLLLINKEENFIIFKIKSI